MDLQLAGKTALVTGASAGLGRNIAGLLAREGCRLAIVARRQGLLEELADEIAATGCQRPAVITCDITLPEAPTMRERALAQRCTAPLGGTPPFMARGSSEPVRLTMRPKRRSRMPSTKAWARSRPA